MTRPTVGVAVAVAGAVALLAGCSQAAAIAPVGGDRQATIRFAGNDVLAEQAVAVLVSPTCTQDASGVTCTGRTVPGETIRFVCPPGNPALLTVTVADRRLYSGPVQDVIDRAGRPT